MGTSGALMLLMFAVQRSPGEDDHDRDQDHPDRRRGPGRRQGGGSPAQGGVRRPGRPVRQRGAPAVPAPAAVEGVPARRGASSRRSSSIPRAGTPSSAWSSRPSTTVDAIDPAAREVVLGDGRRVGFDRLLLATGSEPRRLAVPGADLAGIRFLRTIDDSDALREAAATASRVVVDRPGLDRRGGGGVDPAARPRRDVRHRRVGPARAGARPRGRRDLPRRARRARRADRARPAGRRVPREQRGGRGRRDGRRDADRRRPRGRRDRRHAADRARRGGGPGGRGRRSSSTRRLETSVPGHLRGGRHRQRGAPGTRAAAAVPALGQRAPPGRARRPGTCSATPSPTSACPYFYSDQFDLGMEYAGYPSTWDRVVFRGDVAGKAFVAFWLQRRPRDRRDERERPQGQRGDLEARRVGGRRRRCDRLRRRRTCRLEELAARRTRRGSAAEDRQRAVAIGHAQPLPALAGGIDDHLRLAGHDQPGRQDDDAQQREDRSCRRRAARP